MSVFQFVSSSSTFETWSTWSKTMLLLGFFNLDFSSSSTFEISLTNWISRLVSPLISPPRQFVEHVLSTREVSPTNVVGIPTREHDRFCSNFLDRFFTRFSNFF